MLIAMAGLPGAGKSALGRELAKQLPAVLLDKDAIRAALFPPGEIEYSTPQDDFCLSIMLQVAGYLSAKDPEKRIILDGRPFIWRYQRQDVVSFATKHALPLRFIECVCSEQSARLRLDQDESDARHPAGNRNFELYLRLKANLEPLQEERLVVDTEAPFADCVAQCIAYLRGLVEA